jgi:hypothetical protein
VNLGLDKKVVVWTSAEAASLGSALSPSDIFFHSR